MLLLSSGEGDPPRPSTSHPETIDRFVLASGLLSLYAMGGLHRPGIFYYVLSFPCFLVRSFFGRPVSTPHCSPRYAPPAARVLKRGTEERRGDHCGWRVGVSTALMRLPQSVSGRSRRLVLVCLRQASQQECIVLVWPFSLWFCSWYK